jgi:hypothetical protein
MCASSGSSRLPTQQQQQQQQQLGHEYCTYGLTG